MFKPTPPIVALIFAAGIGGFFLGGATAKDNSLFGPTVAAWAQAVFAAAAVFAGAWLQERFIRRQGEASKRQIYENAASTARWVLQSFQGAKKAAVGRNLRLVDFANLDEQGALTLSMKVLAELKLSDFEDPILATAVFNLQSVMIGVAERRQAQFQMLGVVPSPAVTEGWFTHDETSVFNKAASVERRVAELCGRQAAPLRPS
jgi:hypothetical protein